MRRGAVFVVLCVLAISACTTTLSYKYDGGADGGGGSPDGSVDGPGSAEGSAVDGGLDASGACVGAQFCEDFEKPGFALETRFDLIPLMASSAQYAVVPVGATGKGLSISTVGDFGGFAAPNESFTRAGAVPSIEIKCTVTLTKGRKATLLELFDGATQIKVHVRDGGLLVDGQPLIDGVIPTTADAFVLTAVFTGDTSTTLSGSVNSSTFNQGGLPPLGKNVRVRFAQERDPDGTMAFPTEAIFDDIVIR